jgi:hypothetical protein
VNQSVVNNLAKATKGSMAIPGIKFVEEKVMKVCQRKISIKFSLLCNLLT